MGQMKQSESWWVHHFKSLEQEMVSEWVHMKQLGEQWVHHWEKLEQQMVSEWVPWILFHRG